ncbi:MAG: hypothetical protein RMX65_033820 [Nostoc sp. DedQUE01]|nr:hypothetical protein [Nostoc sp. DedQUE11]MDZ8074723.1 hypothetical protein [Nostoc sp. DedQUE01]
MGNGRWAMGDGRWLSEDAMNRVSTNGLFVALFLRLVLFKHHINIGILFDL